MPLALFPWKKADQTSESTEAEPAWQPQPDKAATFFDKARTVHETTNFEYAIQLWLGGLRFEPTNMPAIQGLARSMANFLSDPKNKKGLSKETLAPISGKAEVDRFLTALVDWMLRPDGDAILPTRAAELAGKLGFIEPTKWIAERAFAANQKDKRPRKEIYLKLSDAFAAVGSFDVSIRCAEAALKVDPTDADLALKIRNLSAQSAMNKGGFNQTGQAGGFRANLRDAERQKQLEEADRVVKTGDTIERVIAAAEADYATRVLDISALNKLVRALLERGTPPDENRAYDLLMQGYMATQTFSLRQMAGDIRIRQARRKVAEAKQMAEKAPGDAMVASILNSAEEDLAKLEITEYKARLEAYPTDMSLKYELGRRYFESGMYGECIEYLQQSQNDPKNRVASLNMLGQAFLKVDYISEAVEMFRQALENRDIGAETDLDLRYGLLMALQTKAEHEKDLAAAEEADKVASSITIKQFTYRDVRQRRDAVKKLITALKGA